LEPAVTEPQTARLTIARIGHKGDGETAEGIYVPFSAAGDVVMAEIEDGRARIHRIVTQSPDRVEPPCPHFGRCGGCALQHVGDEALAKWKREQIATALSQRGLRDVHIAETLTVPRQSRRRAELHARLTDHELKLGFLERGTRIIVDMEACEILTPALFAALPKLRLGLARFLTPHKHVAVHLLDTIGGLDVALGVPDLELTAKSRATAAALAQDLDVARLSVNGEIIVQRREPAVMIAGVPVIPPPEGFLQAAAEAERAMQAKVCAALGKAKSALDIFSGCGTFALAMAKTMRVHAVESDGAALAALERAVKATQGLKPLTVEKRDLFRRPLIAQELDKFDAAVLDPPRPGAKPQCEQLAKSKLQTVVYVSCNVATFARDAEILVAGGFHLESVTPVDQFLWTPHVEMTAVFRRRAS
jgi:23S rRNA (uracil1939-C5)-methyltransferase